MVSALGGLSAFIVGIGLSISHAQAQNPGAAYGNNLVGQFRQRNIDPPQSLAALGSHAAASEDVVRLSQARVVVANYELIRRDFPQLKELSNSEIDRWLLDQVAYISKPQANQVVVNSPIPVDKKQSRRVHRPSEYRRAWVAELSHPQDSTQKIGLMDVKGGGSLAPEQGSHRNGLSSLGECLREFVMEHLVSSVLEDARSSIGTVGSYAVIDGGFDVIHQDGSRSRAGLYLRQAHSGRAFSISSIAELEPIFKRYGINVNSNYQGTGSKALVDFGHYYVDHSLPGVDANKLPPQSHWQIDSTLRPSPRDDDFFYSKHDKPWYFAHDTARAIANGSVDAARNHFEQMKVSLGDRYKARENTNAHFETALKNFTKLPTLEREGIVDFALQSRGPQSEAIFDVAFEKLSAAERYSLILKLIKTRPDVDLLTRLSRIWKGLSAYDQEVLFGAVYSAISKTPTLPGIQNASLADFLKTITSSPSAPLTKEVNKEIVSLLANFLDRSEVQKAAIDILTKSSAEGPHHLRQPLLIAMTQKVNPTQGKIFETIKSELSILVPGSSAEFFSALKSNPSVDAQFLLAEQALSLADTELSRAAKGFLATLPSLRALKYHRQNLLQDSDFDTKNASMGALLGFSPEDLNRPATVQLILELIKKDDSQQLLDFLSVAYHDLDSKNKLVVERALLKRGQEFGQIFKSVAEKQMTRKNLKIKDLHLLFSRAELPSKSALSALKLSEGGFEKNFKRLQQNPSALAKQNLLGALAEAMVELEPKHRENFVKLHKKSLESLTQDRKLFLTKDSLVLHSYTGDKESLDRLIASYAAEGNPVQRNEILAALNRNLVKGDFLLDFIWSAFNHPNPIVIPELSENALSIIPQIARGAGAATELSRAKAFDFLTKLSKHSQGEALLEQALNVWLSSFASARDAQFDDFFFNLLEHSSPDFQLRLFNLVLELEPSVDSLGRYVYDDRFLKLVQKNARLEQGFFRWLSRAGSHTVAALFERFLGEVGTDPSFLARLQQQLLLHSKDSVGPKLNLQINLALASKNPSLREAGYRAKLSQELAPERRDYLLKRMATDPSPQIRSLANEFSKNLQSGLGAGCDQQLRDLL